MTSLNEFWQVVWYYDITMIIMLTDLHENRKELCTRYWPMTSLHTMKCGPISIKIDHADYLRDKDSWRRGFTLMKGAEVKEVTQLQFNGWGDEGNPPIYFTLLDWLAEIHLCRNNGGSVLIIHSDGAGRSG
uniref:protein-tyrosine-phosphatase n=1 Tax=Ciona savignyi TaxID=51511 RepID=H2YN03_CIOSA